MIHLGDITKIHGNQIEPVHCIIFGSPCQDLSMAGLAATAQCCLWMPSELSER